MVEEYIFVFLISIDQVLVKDGIDIIDCIDVVLVGEYSSKSDQV